MTSRANATFSYTVLFGSSLKSWNTVPIERRRCGIFQLGRAEACLPATQMSPFGRAFFAHHQPDEGRLARPGRTDEEHELTLGDVEPDVLDGDDATVVDLRDVFETNHGREALDSR